MNLRPKAFWTPRYVRDRLALAYYQWREPEAPWWPAEATARLADLLRPSDTCLEWGSGRSTAWLSARTNRVVSIEDDPEWWARVQERLAGGGGSVRLLSSEPAQQPGASPYVRVVEEFADGEIDVFIVDGKHRAECALAALPKLAPGGIMLVDDIHRYLDHPTHAPFSRRGRGPLNADWKRFAAEVESWRRIWVTDGVKDTAMWFKPS